MKGLLVGLLLLLLAACGQGSRPVNGGPWVEVSRRDSAIESSASVLDNAGYQSHDRVLAGCASGAAGVAIVHGPLAVMLVIAIVWAVAHRRRARAERSSDPRAPLKNGPAVLVGTV
ncbi:MAG: hypothetical protein WCJ30_06585, partial [Deltaproteobacteria bacterium]